MKKDRKEVLLRAAYDLLTVCAEGPYALDAMEVTVWYDEAECDGGCLHDDIAFELGIDPDDTPPLTATHRAEG